MISLLSPAKRQQWELIVSLTVMLVFRCVFSILFLYVLTSFLRNLIQLLTELHGSDTLGTLNVLLTQQLIPLLLCFYLYTLSDSKFVPALYAVVVAPCVVVLRQGVWWIWGKAAARRPSAATPTQAAARGHHADPAVEAQLIAVIPMLLSHLPLADRRSLWQVSKQLALEVWRSSPAVKLSLSNTSPVISWTMPLQLLASSRPAPLAQLITSRRPGFLPEGVFFQRIQSLSLSHMQLDTSSFTSLKTLLPSLRHLSLLTCQIKPAPNTHQAAAADSNATTCAKRKALLRVCSFVSWESEAAALVDHRHLQSLGTDDPGIFSMLASRQFPALRVLRLISGVVDDAQLDVLLGSKPQMQEVWLPQLQLRRDHSAQACSWGLLRLQGNPLGVSSGLHALELALLPLEGIRRLVVEKELYAWSSGDVRDLKEHGCVWSTAWPRLREAAKHLEFEPGIMGWGHLWAWSNTCTSQVDLGLEDNEPGFTLHLTRPSSSPLSTPPEARRLAVVVASRLQGGTFVYSGCDLTDPAAALLPLQSLPSTVHSLVLRNCWDVPRDPRVLFARLPLHVERLVVKSDQLFAVHPKILRKEYRREQAALAAAAAHH